MSSLTRKMQKRLMRAEKSPLAAIALRGQKRGINLGVRNPRAPKPNSLPARGSRRTINRKNPWRGQHGDGGSGV